MKMKNVYDGYKYPSEITDQHIQTYLDDMKELMPTWEHQIVDGVLYLTKIRTSDGKLIEDYTKQEFTPFGEVVTPSSILESVAASLEKRVDYNAPILDKAEDSDMVVTSDNFIWLNVTDKARDIWNSGLFELYDVDFSENSEGLIENAEDLNSAIERGCVCIEVGHFYVGGNSIFPSSI